METGVSEEIWGSEETGLSERGVRGFRGDMGSEIKILTTKFRVSQRKCHLLQILSDGSIRSIFGKEKTLLWRPS